MSSTDTKGTGVTEQVSERVKHFLERLHLSREKSNFGLPIENQSPTATAKTWMAKHEGKTLRFKSKGAEDRLYAVVNRGGTLVRTPPRPRGRRYLRKRGLLETSTIQTESPKAQ